MPLGNFSLKDKIAVVTGGGSGISFSWIQLAINEGAKIIIADLRLTPAAETYIQKLGASRAIFAKTDVSKRAELENLITVSENHFGDVPDVYICGAAIFELPHSNFWDDTEENTYATLAVNVAHPMKLSRIAIKALLRKQKKGVILIVSSLAGYQGTFAAPLYCASKHAVIGFVRSMAMLDDLEGIKIVAVAPGLVNTPMWTDHPAKMKQYGYTPETAVEPIAVANAMLDLCTQGQYPGGACLEVSLGGTRQLGTWNIAEPASAGTTVAKEVIDNMIGPVKRIMDRERGSKL